MVAVGLVVRGIARERTDARVRHEEIALHEPLGRLSHSKADDREAIRALSAEIRHVIEGIAIPDDLTASAMAKDATLQHFSGVVEDSGEGRWTVEAAIEEAVPADVLAASLFTRFRSRQEHTFAEKVLSAMRFGFGGHVEPPSKA